MREHCDRTSVSLLDKNCLRRILKMWTDRITNPQTDTSTDNKGQKAERSQTNKALHLLGTWPS